MHRQSREKNVKIILTNNQFCVLLGLGSRPVQSDDGKIEKRNSVQGNNQTLLLQVSHAL